jgi:hypothetical protein
MGGHGGDVRIKLAQPISASGHLAVKAGGGQGGDGGSGGFYGLGGKGGNPGNSDSPCPQPQTGDRGLPGVLGIKGAPGSHGAQGIFELKAGTQQIQGPISLDQEEGIHIP